MGDHAPYVFDLRMGRFYPLHSNNLLIYIDIQVQCVLH
jgi:hypothetical protein